jgi:hypothetical protein
VKRGGALLHPDQVVGQLSRLLLRVANPVDNTLGNLGVYLGRPAGELFPAPRRTPEVTIASRWRLPGLLSEDLTFTSLHELPTFRRRYTAQYKTRVYAPSGGDSAQARGCVPARLHAAGDLRQELRC